MVLLAQILVDPLMHAIAFKGPRLEVMGMLG